MDDFDFIADQQFKALLIRDFKELENCLTNKANKAVLILSGSIIETVLLEFFTHNLPINKSVSQLLKMDLSDLINEAEGAGLISTKSKDLSIVVKNFRNLIHPGREIRKKESFDNETAIVSFNLVKMILKELKENYVKKYGYKAEDIFNKIIVDRSTYSIYSKLILKLNNHEKNRLTTLLVDYQIANYEDSQSENYNKYIMPLKSQIGNENLLAFCKYLLKEVENGKQHKILAIFDIFGNNLDLLLDDEKDLILTYIYNIMSNISVWDKSIESPKFRGLFSFLSLYMHTPELKQKFFDLLSRIVRVYNIREKDNWYYISAFQNMISNFSNDKKEKCEVYIRENIKKEIADKFYTALEDDVDLPF